MTTKSMKILTTFVGPCIYKRGVLEDGTTTGRVQYTGQKDEELQAELLATLESGRDDVQSFVDGVLAHDN